MADSGGGAGRIPGTTYDALRRGVLETFWRRARHPTLSLPFFCLGEGEGEGERAAARARDPLGGGSELPIVHRGRGLS
jgi:hypothetical protein